MCIVVASGSNIASGARTMARDQPGSVLRQLRALFTSGTAAGLSDRQLLERFTAERAQSVDAAHAAEMAFAALMDRHGAMVWGVCRRVLGDTHEAEDAFQATFLVLVRKAGSVQVDGSLGRWLYGVAHRVAARARSEAQRRSLRSADGAEVVADDPAVEVELRDLRAALGEEVDRLPIKYRCPIELCHLQGLTYDQAARQLDWPVATVKSRLAKGRLRLRERLVKRGLAPLSAGLSATLVPESRAAVPHALVHSTVRAATSCVYGVFPTAVTHLSEEVLKMMIWDKLKWVAAAALVAVGLTAGALAQQTSRNRIAASEPPKAEAPPSEKPSKGAAADPRWVRTLSNGASIEVIGISAHPSGPDTWWRPDGTPLQQAPYDRSSNELTTAEDYVARAIAVRLTGVPAGAEYHWSIDQSGSSAGGEARRAGKPISGLSAYITEFPSRLKTSAVRFEVATGPWVTVQTWGNNPGSRGSRDGSNYIFGQALATEKGSTLSVTHNLKDVSVRLIAVDRKGKEHTAETRSGAGVSDYHQLVVEFDLPPEQIEEFRVQTRNFERVELPGVALKPVGAE